MAPLNELCHLMPNAVKYPALRWQNIYVASREKKISIKILNTRLNDFTSVLAMTKLINVEKCDDELLIKMYTRISHEEQLEKISY